MGIDLSYIRSGVALCIILVACVLLYRWAKKEKAATTNPDHEFGWFIVQSIAISTAGTFTGTFILEVVITAFLRG